MSWVESIIQAWGWFSLCLGLVVGIIVLICKIGASVYEALLLECEREADEE
jgi:hypothetical protein